MMGEYKLDFTIEIPGRTTTIITLDSNRFFVGERTNVEYCSWTTSYGGSISGGPTIENGIVYFGACDQYVYAVDGKNGKEMWRFESSVKTKSMIENIDRMPMVAPEVERIIREDAEGMESGIGTKEDGISESTYSARIEYVFRDVYGGRKKKYENI